MRDATPHPLIPNSAPSTRAEMLAVLGVADVDELYESIPERLRFRGSLALPEALDELGVERFVGGLLDRDLPCGELLSFLGAGCWQHYVPAACDEIARRAEFLTAYWANAYSDYGKHQAFFEYASLLGELLEMDAVSLPTYDWGNAAAVSLRMAARLTGRDEIVLPRDLAPERRAVVLNSLKPDLRVREVGFDLATGSLDLDALGDAVSERTAAVYVENPSYLGLIEPRGEAIAELAHERGALLVVGVDPSSLGVLAPPAAYGADIVCGELQPLGMHMDFGGGLAGFVATPDTEEYIGEYPTFLIGITDTDDPDEHGFGLVAWERTSYMRREAGKDFGGTTTGLWAITAAVYLSLLGPNGMRELGEGILQRSHYAALRLGAVEGVTAPAVRGPFFKELVVGFGESGRTVEEINRSLLEQGIVGGRDLSRELPELGQSALFCVTEVHTQADLDRLAEAIRTAIRA